MILFDYKLAINVRYVYQIDDIRTNSVYNTEQIKLIEYCIICGLSFIDRTNISYNLKKDLLNLPHILEIITSYLFNEYQYYYITYDMYVRSLLYYYDSKNNKLLNIIKI